MKRLAVFALFALVVAFAVAPLVAQGPAGQPPADPAASALRTGFDNITRNLSESVTKMPEENFAFKPTADVRSFGELIGHVANSHYSYCSRVKGEANPNAGKDLEKVTVKADLAKAFNDSVEYCKAVYASMTDAKLGTGVTPPAPATAAPQAGQKPQAPAGQLPAARPVLPMNVLLQNLTHDWEHYGNVVTYLRLKGLVPPSTERTQKR